MAARVLLRAIKDGACPCFLADLRDDNGPFVPFFGQPARSTAFPALLARTTGVPLYAGAAFRRPGGRFSIRIVPISMPQTNNSAADALAATQALQRQYEAFIRETPEQWMWAHRKSNTRRQGPGPEESRRGGDRSSDSMIPTCSLAWRGV
jgi:Kdo2-lipid IVA lauroyltransferase/acyltransferase